MSRLKVLDWTDTKEYYHRFINLGPVLLGPKPAELLSFSGCNPEMSSKIAKLDRCFSICNKIKHRIFNYKNKGKKILIYNPSILDETLKEKRNFRFLKEIGYPEEYDLEIFLDQLINKFEKGELPPELGVFLGYPLKDVIGFIGHPSLKLTKIKGWRVYGDPRVSDKRYNEFLIAKDKVKDLLRSINPQQLLLVL